MQNQNKKDILIHCFMVVIILQKQNHDLRRHCIGVLCTLLLNELKPYCGRGYSWKGWRQKWENLVAQDVYTFLINRTQKIAALKRTIGPFNEKDLK